MSINDPLIFLVTLTILLALLYYYRSYIFLRLHVSRYKIKKDRENEQPSKTASTKECPNCQGKMQEGYLIGPRGIYWSSEGVTPQMDIMSSFPGIGLPPGFGFRPQFFKAYQCGKCGTVLVERFYSVGY